MEPLPLYRVVVPVVAVGLFAAFCAVRNIPRQRIALLGILAMSGYGMLQDQISARLCPEYFTVFHNPLPGGVSDPTLVGIGWGFLGSWWGGLALGYAAGLTATLGKNPPLGPRELLKPVGVLLLGVAAATAACGVSVWMYADAFEIRLHPLFDAKLPPERHRGLFTVSCYHLVAYASAIVGSVLLCGWIAWQRRSLADRVRQGADAGD